MSVPATLIAIVDDDELQCRSLRRLVERAGFKAETFRSAEDFLASPGRTRFKCILLDIHLGGMSGFALHQQLRSESDPTPVIYLTAHEDEGTRAAAAKTDCAAFFLKTDDSGAIIDALRRSTSTQ
jgi:FixJ family two-component response regulator